MREALIVQLVLTLLLFLPKFLQNRRPIPKARTLSLIKRDDVMYQSTAPREKHKLKRSEVFSINNLKKKKKVFSLRTTFSTHEAFFPILA